MLGTTGILGQCLHTKWLYVLVHSAFYLCEPTLHAAMVNALLSVAVTRMVVLLRQRSKIDYAKNYMGKWKHPLRVESELRTNTIDCFHPGNCFHGH